VFRIGVNLGDVIQDGDSIFGDGVNIASRIQEVANPGGICISQDVYNQIYNKIPITMVPLGKKYLKNITKAMELYQLPAQRPLPPEREATSLPRRAEENDEVAERSSIEPVPRRPMDLSTSIKDLIADFPSKSLAKCGMNLNKM